MRKLFLMLAVLLLASAAYAADVTISCTADGNEVTVSYTASADVNIPRGFGLDIKLSNDETITSVTPLDPNYWVYPGTYGDTNVPVGDPCDSSDTLPGIDSNGVTIEMGSLHSPTDPCASNPNAPDISNDLLKFTVSGGCDVNIVGNAARGKVVFYDATNEDDGRVVVYTGCTVTTDCFYVGMVDGCGYTVTQADYDMWVSLGKPDCWCYPCHCRGDADNSCTITSSDIQTARNAWPFAPVNGPYDECADVDYSGTITSSDIQAIRNSWPFAPVNGPGCSGIPGCP